MFGFQICNKGSATTWREYGKRRVPLFNFEDEIHMFESGENDKLLGGGLVPVLAAIKIDSGTLRIPLPRKANGLESPVTGATEVAAFIEYGSDMNL